MIGRRLPDLGPRGEGWFLIQLLLFGAIALAGSLGPAWAGVARSVGLAAGAGLIVCGGFSSLSVESSTCRENLTPFPRPLPGARLVETGAYRLARHPIYGGLILGAFGWGLATASPVALGLAGVLAVFFDLKSRREEVWLADQFDGYAAYRRRTRRLFALGLLSRSPSGPRPPLAREPPSAPYWRFFWTRMRPDACQAFMPPSRFQTLV